jgi:polysaccharide pyruvyl transferase WcaK-like protein
MKYKKAYCILPQTIGPFKDAKIRSLALKAIAKASCVMVRDKQSLDFVKRELPDKPVSEIIDVAFFMPYKKKSFDDKYVHVGLNISGLLWHGGYTQDNQFGLVSDYQSVIRDIIDYFLSLENVKLHLISHVVAENRIIENDYAVAYDLCEEYSHPNLILSPMFLDAIAAKGYISGMDFFMGARMHATIAAFSSNVPVYPMAYSRKFNGLFVDTLQYDYIGDMKVQSASDMLSDIKNAFVNRSVLKSLISNRMSTIVEDRRNLLVKELEKFLGL